ncbi:MAG: TraR/DksA C4-type zinc finger protein [Planctomycetaceae bacterium]|nr:TraR/DksA C4-type zinc finger protein [Planctomycetaceae bacterium]
MRKTKPRHKARKTEDAGLTRQDLDRFRALLIEQRKDFQQRIERLRDRANEESPEARGELSSVPLHLADLASESFEQEKELAMSERDSAAAVEIDEALERIEEGTYGLCVRCGKPITRERLRTLPRAARCLRCQSQEEK